MFVAVIALIWNFIGAAPALKLTPSDPLVIPVLTPTNVSCSNTTGWIMGWKIFDSNNQIISNSGQINNQFTVYAKGFTAIEHRYESILLINTSITGLYYLQCDALEKNGSSTYILEKLTVYGVPEAPYNVSVRVNNKFLDTAWNFQRIETVKVTFNLFLKFLKPKGNKSCDPFSLCITGNNSVGRGNTSCINGSLPYVPSQDMISYSLSPDHDSYILSVSVTKSLCLQDSNTSFILELTNSKTLKNTLSLDTLLTNCSIMISIGNLTRSTSFKANLLSRNMYGIHKFLLGNICTNDIKGLIACLTQEKDTYKVTCDYVEGCNHSGCIFQIITTRNNFTNITIKGDEHPIINVSKHDKFLVKDLRGEIVQNEMLELKDFAPQCELTKAQDCIILASSIAAVLATIFIMTVSIIIVLLIRRHRSGRKSLNIRSLTYQKSEIDTEVSPKPATQSDKLGLYNSLNDISPPGADKIMKEGHIYFVLEKENQNNLREDKNS